MTEVRKDLHDDLIARLRSDLDAFAGAPVDAPGLGNLALDGPPSSRRPWLLVGAAAATVVMLVAGLVLLIGDGSAEVELSSSEVAPTVPAPAVDAMPVPPTPEGWVVVEWGDVRFSLPPELTPFGDAPMCATKTGDGTGRLGMTCGDRSIDVLSGLAGPVDADANRRVNGMLVTLTPLPDEPNATQLQMDETQSRIRFWGFADDEIEAIVATAGVSSRWRVDNEPAPPVPDGWRAIGFDNVQMMVPGDWPSVDIDPSAADPDICGFRGLEPVAAFGRGGAVASCVDSASIVAPPSDGMRIYELLPSEGAIEHLGYPYTERVFGVNGEGRRFLVRVGLGGDGTIGRTILGSLTIIPEAAPGALTVPPTSGSTAPPVPSTAPPADTTMYETAMTVIQSDGVPQLCVNGVFDSGPPQCDGVDLVGFEWADVTPEGSQGGTTWGPAYVRGTYDRTTDTMTVIEARPPTEADGSRLAAAMDTRRDKSVPCPSPAGGWPPPPDVWPGQRLVEVGVSEWWLDDTNSVLIVKTTGDLTATVTAVRTIYDGPLCVVAQPDTDQSELRRIAADLESMSPAFITMNVTFDPNDAWITAVVVAPDPNLQASLDAEFGEGTVRLASILQPVG